MKIIFLLFALSLPIFAAKSVEVFVCLCDNEHQGIAKVGAKIGNGMDPAGNLYWGCDDGLSTYFKRSSKWKLTKTTKPKDSPILVTLNFTHHSGKMTLIAHAYRGDRMEKCLEDFFTKSRDAGKDELIAFIGHNGMMDSLPVIPGTAKEGDVASESIVLACLTESYFPKHLKAMNSKPLLLTKSLMYPGSFILHDALEIWLKGGSKNDMREAAAKAYAKNQKISVNSARTVFAEPKE
ncbi:hypothetical protein V2O64_17500 [Verrucomicrobiaceae bacterium 227]